MLVHNVALFFRLRWSSRRLVAYSRFAVTIFSTPLRGVKNKNSEECVEIMNLKLLPGHLYSSREY